jgi:hypothetical protein
VPSARQWRSATSARPTSAYAAAKLRTEQEARALLAESAAGMPDAHLEVYVRTYMERHGISVLGAAEGR